MKLQLDQFIFTENVGLIVCKFARTSAILVTIVNKVAEFPLIIFGTNEIFHS